MLPAIMSLAEDKKASRVIDVIRGLAILIVILVHTKNFMSSYGISAEYDSVTMLITYATAGVGLFFFISGYLLDFLYRKELKIKTYSVRRLGRIFPAWIFWNLIAVLAATFSIKWWFQNENIMEYFYGSSVAPNSITNISEIIISMIFLGWISMTIWNNFVPGGWSIQAEIINYTIFPFINKFKIEIVFFILLLITCTGAIFNLDNNPIISSFVTSPYWFILGIFVSRIVRRYLKKDLDEPKISPLGWTLFIALSIATCSLKGPHIHQQITMIVVIVSIVLAILISDKNNSMTKLIVKIGKYSYGMYFSHFAITLPFSYIGWLIAKNLNVNGLLYLCIVFIMFIMISFISYWVSKFTYFAFEKYFIKLSHKY